MSQAATAGHTTIRYGEHEVRVTGFPGDHIFEIIQRTGGFYEIDLLEYMRFVLKPFENENAMCVDVGANIGNHSMYFGTFLCDFVISVEPNPLILPLLEENLSTNLSSYALRSCALGEADGEGHVQCTGTANYGGARIDTNADGPDDTAVRVRTLDSVVDGVREEEGVQARVLLVKIDVEGMEERVLAGASKTLERDRPEVFVEAATRAHYATLRRQLAGLGYAPISRWAATPVYHFSYRPTWAYRLAAYRYMLASKPSHYVKKLLRLR